MKVVDVVTKHIPAAWFDHAVGVVAALAARSVSNDTKRDVAIEMLQKQLHVPEHLARVLVELGVLAVKTSGDEPGHHRSEADSSIGQL